MTTHILFVCSENRLRSPTAAAVFSEFENIETISAGTNADCRTPLSAELIEWADVVLVMEERHRGMIFRDYRDLLENKTVAVLEIPDIFPFMDPMLVALLKARVPRYVRIDPS